VQEAITTRGDAVEQKALHRRSPAPGIALRHSRSCAPGWPLLVPADLSGAGLGRAAAKADPTQFRTLADARAWRQDTQVAHAALAHASFSGCPDPQQVVCPHRPFRGAVAAKRASYPDGRNAGASRPGQSCARPLPDELVGAEPKIAAIPQEDEGEVLSVAAGLQLLCTS
jgi:hypothetical protein